MQNAAQNRFQEYAPNYMDGEEKTDLIPIHLIDKVPLWFFVAKQDEVAPSITAKMTTNEIDGAVKSYHVFPTYSHYSFTSANDD